MLIDLLNTRRPIDRLVLGRAIADRYGLRSDTGAGGGTGGGTGGDGGAGGSDDGAGGDGGGQGGQGGGGDKTFTQADIDRIVTERLARAKGATPPDYEDLKAAAAELAELKKSQLDDLQRAQQERDEANQERDKAKAWASDVAKRTAVQLAAMAAGAADPDDVYALLPKDAVTVGDDGQVTGAAEAVKELLNKKPHLVGKKNTPGDADGGSREGGQDKKSNTLEDAVTRHLAKT